MGSGMAHKRGAPSSDVTPMGVSHSYEEALLEDYEAPEYTDLFGKQEVLIDCADCPDAILFMLRHYKFDGWGDNAFKK